MSYILDALKKSEEERHQGQVPNLGSGSTLIYNRRSKTTVWPWLLAALLLLNLSAVAYWLLNDQMEGTTLVEGDSVESQSTTPSRQLLTQPVTERAEQTQVSESQLLTAYETLPDNKTLVASNIERTVVTTPVTEDKNSQFNVDLQDVELTKSQDSDDSESAGIDVESREPLLITPKSGARKYAGPGYEDKSPSLQAASVSEPTQEGQSEHRDTATSYAGDRVIPHLSDMPEGFQKRIPDMAFNSHIYTNAADFRRVMINNIYLREKQSFSGLVVEQITEQGIVLSLDGKSFRMGVLRDWHSPR